jgi:hypothetical protein
VLVQVRRIHRRDLSRVWEFLKHVFRGVNRETVEYQRPRSKKRFLEVYEEEGIEQLLFEVKHGTRREIVGYAECAFEITGTDNWMNARYFSSRDMRPLFVEERAFQKLDAAIFLAKKIASEEEILPPRKLKGPRKHASARQVTGAPKRPRARRVKEPAP